jgi:hypothetical protein
MTALQIMLLTFSLFVCGAAYIHHSIKNRGARVMVRGSRRRE